MQAQTCDSTWSIRGMNTLVLHVWINFITCNYYVQAQRKERCWSDDVEMTLLVLFCFFSSVAGIESVVRHLHLRDVKHQWYSVIVYIRLSTTSYFISNITIRFVSCQVGIMARGYVTGHRAGFPPITRKKYSMNTCAPAIYVRGIDC